MKNSLMLTSKEAILEIKSIAKFLQDKFANDGFNEVRIKMRKDVLMIDSVTLSPITSKPYMYIGIKDIFKPNLMQKPSSKLIDDADFIKSLVALFHESRHLDSYLYFCKDFRDNVQDDYYLLISHMAIENNRMYYESNYSNMACEIDAEQYAINSTYQYLKNQFPNCDYESLIVNYVNEMIQQGDYKIDFSNNKKYSSFEQIIVTFDEKFERSKNTQRIVNIASPDKTICLLSNSEWQDVKNSITSLMAKEDYPNCGVKMDEMMASLTSYQYPRYSKLLPYEWQEKLSSQSVFGLEEFPLEDWQLDYYYYRDDERG